MGNEKYFAFYRTIKFIFRFLFLSFCVCFPVFSANCITYRHFAALHRFFTLQVIFAFPAFSTFSAGFLSFANSCKITPKSAIIPSFRLFKSANRHFPARRFVIFSDFFVVSSAKIVQLTQGYPLQSRTAQRHRPLPALSRRVPAAIFHCTELCGKTDRMTYAQPGTDG